MIDEMKGMAPELRGRGKTPVTHPVAIKLVYPGDPTNWWSQTSDLTCFTLAAVDPLIPGHGQTIPRSVSRTRQHHLNVAREPSWLS